MGSRINRILAPLLEVNATESVQGHQVPVGILDQLKSFIQKQEEFNQHLVQRIKDNFNQIQQGQEKKVKTLPQRSYSKLNTFVVFTFFRILFIIIFFRAPLKF